MDDKKKKKYVVPEAEVVNISEEDVIVTSLAYDENADFMTEEW